MKSLLLMGLSAFAGLSLSACSGSSGGGGGGGGTTATNKFSGSSRAMTAADVAPTTRTGMQAYYGSFLYKNGSDVYAGGINFTVENTGTQLYFKTFAFEKVIHYTAYNTSGTVETTGVTCFTNGTYNATTNFVNVNNTTSRLVNFSVDLGAGTCNAAGFGDINNAGVIFSSDFTTMAGGDNASFFFLAQKTSAQGSFTLADMDGTANLYWFDVDTSGNITAVTSNSPSVTTTSGSWTTADTAGVMKLADSAMGAYIYKYNHTGASSIDGGFVVTPDKNFLMGIDLVTGYYFAASR